MNSVEFPGLGLHFNTKREAIENLFGINGFDIYWYGIIIAAAFLLVVLLGLKDCKKFGIEPDNILDLVLFAAPVAIVTARLYYVFFSWDQFKDNLADIINTRKGGLAIYGAVIGALLVAYFYTRVKKIKTLNFLDFCIPYLVLAQGIGRWGNFFNQEAFGTATMLPWRMNSETINSFLGRYQQNMDFSVWGAHPTFLYESLLDIAIFFFLIWYRKRKKLDGEVFSLYMILYGAGRFFIEGLRTDSLMAGSIRISQLLSLLLAITFVIIFVVRRKNIKAIADDAPVELGKSSYGELLMKLKEEESSGTEVGINEPTEINVEPDADHKKENGNDAESNKEPEINEETEE